MKKNRFLPANSPVNGDILLVIEDFAWFSIHNQDIVDWMRDNLPRGADHQRGMILTFDNEQQRSWFLLKWA